MIIERFRDTGISAIKITPHFHETTQGLLLLSEEPGYSVYLETEAGTDKDTSRMLRAGASKVFFAKVRDHDLVAAFRAIMKHIPEGMAVVCESPALRYYIEPGAFFIMNSDSAHNTKDISRLQVFPHVMLHLDDLARIDSVLVRFENGHWIS